MVRGASRTSRQRKWSTTRQLRPPRKQPVRRSRREASSNRSLQGRSPPNRQFLRREPARLSFWLLAFLYQPSKVVTLFCSATVVVILFCLTGLIREIGDGRGDQAAAGFRSG